MANDDHTAMLGKGVAAWNAWREKNAHIFPDLDAANLREADLGRADLGRAKLNRADLGGADLHQANLTGANLNEADLTGANLSGANLGEADLSRASLTGANLIGAILTGTVLTGANLGEANLHSANLRGAILSTADLGRAELGRAELHGANLYEANLYEANLLEASLLGANLSGTNLSGANLYEANLHEADLHRADLRRANLRRANLSEANLSEANLSGASLREADLRDANLSGGDLMGSQMVETDLTGTNLTGCYIYGVSAWSLKLDGAKQQNLVVTPSHEPEITVDNIEVAQFVYLLLHNPKIRDVIDTIGKKGVLLLGRFTEGRIEVLERLRAKLRELGFVPMVFNFDKPETKDFTETVRLLANLSHFVIVDITNPRATPLELQATVPDYMVPFVPILENGQDPFSMFKDLQNKYDWVLDVIVYPSTDRLIEVLEDEIVEPAKAKFDQLLERRAGQLRVKSV